MNTVFNVRVGPDINPEKYHFSLLTGETFVCDTKEEADILQKVLATFKTTEASKFWADYHANSTKPTEVS